MGGRAEVKQRNGCSMQSLENCWLYSSGGQAGGNFSTGAESEEDAGSNVQWAPLTLSRSTLSWHQACKQQYQGTPSHRQDLSTAQRFKPTDSKDLCPHQVTCLRGRVFRGAQHPGGLCRCLQGGKEIAEKLGLPVKAMHLEIWPYGWQNASQNKSWSAYQCHFNKY